MAKDFLKIRSAITGFVPAWSVELRPRPHGIELQSLLIVPNRDFVIELRPSPLSLADRGICQLAMDQYQLFQSTAVVLHGRITDGWKRYVFSSWRPSRQTPVRVSFELVSTGVGTQNHRSSLDCMAPTTGDRHVFSRFGNYPLWKRFALGHQVRHLSARNLPDQGDHDQAKQHKINRVSKHQNHTLRLLRAFISPIESQNRMNQNEEINVNQCIADRRESDCDR